MKSCWWLRCLKHAGWKLSLPTSTDLHFNSDELCCQTKKQLWDKTLNTRVPSKWGEASTDVITVQHGQFSSAKEQQHCQKHCWIISSPLLKAFLILQFDTLWFKAPHFICTEYKTWLCHMQAFLFLLTYAFYFVKYITLHFETTAQWEIGQWSCHMKHFIAASHQ